MYHTNRIHYTPYREVWKKLNANPALITDPVDQTFFDTNGMVRDGYKIPGWRKAIRTRSVGGSTEYFVSYDEVERSPCVWSSIKRMSYYDTWGYLRYGDEQVTYDGFIRPTITNDVPDSAAFDSRLNALDQKAMRDLSRRVRNAYMKVSGMVVLGELRKTLQMIKRPANGLLDSFAQYLRDVQRLIADAKRRFGNDPLRFSNYVKEQLRRLYLEYTYGWSPLISDVKGGAEAAAEILNRRDAGNRIIRSRWFSDSTEALTSLGETTWGSPWNPQVAVTRTKRVTTKARVRYWSLHDYSLARLAISDGIDTLGLSLKEFSPTVWELLPWSFVADYFSNVGDILNMEATDWSRCLDLYYITKTTYETEYVDTPDVAKTIYTWGLQSLIAEKAATKRTLTTYRRLKISPASLHLDFETQLPNLRQWFNIAALTVLQKSIAEQVKETPFNWTPVLNPDDRPPRGGRRRRR